MYCVDNLTIYFLSEGCRARSKVLALRANHVGVLGFESPSSHVNGEKMKSKEDIETMIINLEDEKNKMLATKHDISSYTSTLKIYNAMINVLRWVLTE